MLLATIDDVRGEMTFDDIPDVENAIAGALKASTRVLERRLRTDFDFAARSDTFMVSPTRVQSIPDPQILSNLTAPRRARVGTGLFANSPLYTTEFSLNYGFITSTALADLTVQSATLIGHFTDGDADTVSDLRVFEGDSLDHTFTSQEDGRVYVQQVDVRGLFVRIEYTAGFTVASDDVYESVPNWLVRAAILHTQIMLDKNPVIRRPEGAESMIEVLLTELNHIIDEKTRYHPNAVKPLNST